MATKTKIFVNLPVKDLQKSMDFFSKLGFSFNPQFTNDKAACMVVSEENFIMLLTEAFFQGFLPNKRIADATQTTEVLIAFSREDRSSVDKIMEQALAAGATEARPAEDHGFMYSRSFQDLDGHIWEPLWMDERQVQ